MGCPHSNVSLGLEMQLSSGVLIATTMKKSDLALNLRRWTLLSYIQEHLIL